MARSSRNDGFTLIELMMVVALIGILASIAIPQFIRYQANSRRGEAYINLAALAAAEKGYLAEKDTFYHTGNAWPDFVPYGGLGTHKMTWDAASETAFGPLGWSPEGEVYYSYETNTSVNCDATCDVCFTASAFGDVDGDGLPSALMYVHAEQESGGGLSVCKSILFAFGTPTNFGTGASVYSQVAVNRETDDF